MRVCLSVVGKKLCISNLILFSFVAVAVALFVYLEGGIARDWAVCWPGCLNLNESWRDRFIAWQDEEEAGRGMIDVYNE